MHNVKAAPGRPCQEEHTVHRLELCFRGSCLVPGTAIVAPLRPEPLRAMLRDPVVLGMDSQESAQIVDARQPLEQDAILNRG